ncbi:NADH:flavorubredoxin oxidoreductase [Vibrio alginolyticus]|nr:NADH:flavorubredoxin oxidoreductase [Vibrio alginolyticus]
MSAPIVIIGSGFAAYQLIKNLRRQETALPIQVFTADEGEEYNKPDLSHVFTKQRSADELVQLSGAEFAKQYQVELFTNTWVERVDTKAQCIYVEGQAYPYSKLVFATGASAFVPPIEGNGASSVITLNSLSEYRCSQQQIDAANHVLIMGGGLIGVELAMDLRASGKQVTVVEPNSRLLSNLVPDFVALRLEEQLRSDGIALQLLSRVENITLTDGGVVVTTSLDQDDSVDCVISAAGLRPNTELAREAGINVRRGIVVDKQLRTSSKHVYALGDCAEIDGKVMAYLQPIVLSANTLAKQLLNQESQLSLPPMMVKVKTPSYPIQTGGQVSDAVTWKVEYKKQGVMAEAYDDNNRMVGFVVTSDKVDQAFPLLRTVSSALKQSKSI